MQLNLSSLKLRITHKWIFFDHFLSVFIKKKSLFLKNKKQQTQYGAIFIKVKRMLLTLMVFGIVGCTSTPTEDLQASGEDFPLKYTCELGNIIMFISFDGDGIATFFYHESNIFNKKNIGKKIKINGYTLTKSQINFAKWNARFYLNRFTGKATFGATTFDWSGECFKGFKEYDIKL
jgi:hypothetical protein